MHRPKYTEQGDLKDYKAGHMRRWDTIERECFVSGLYLYKFISFLAEPDSWCDISSRQNGQALKLAPSKIKEIWQPLQVTFGIYLQLNIGASPSIYYCAH